MSWTVTILWQRSLEEQIYMCLFILAACIYKVVQWGLQRAWVEETGKKKLRSRNWPFRTTPSWTAMLAITPRYWSYQESNTRAFSGCEGSAFGLKQDRVQNAEHFPVSWDKFVFRQYTRNNSYITSVIINNVTSTWILNCPTETQPAMSLKMNMN